MPEVSSLSPALSAIAALLILMAGAIVAAIATSIIDARLAGRSSWRAAVEPLWHGASLLGQQTVSTERPDRMLWILAPAVYAALAAVALTVVPLAEGRAIADVRTGIVVFGAAEALAIVAIFMHGWASNSHLSLIGGFRFVALGLSYELVSMFVLIAASLPAESLQVSAMVQAQVGMWNVVAQPLGLPLWLIVTMGVTFLGPLNVADGDDLAGGTSLEVSGRAQLVWQLARFAMLTVFCAMGAAVFLGGWLGPVLPGWAWMATKTLALMWIVIWLAQRAARIPTERAVALLWTVALPLSFVHLVWAGIEVHL